jgi:hypothetical protein
VVAQLLDAGAGNPKYESLGQTASRGQRIGTRVLVAAEPSRSDWGDAEGRTQVLDYRLQLSVLLGHGLILGPGFGLGLGLGQCIHARSPSNSAGNACLVSATWSMIEEIAGPPEQAIVRGRSGLRGPS